MLGCRSRGGLPAVWALVRLLLLCPALHWPESAMPHVQGHSNGGHHLGGLIKLASNSPVHGHARTYAGERAISSSDEVWVMLLLVY